MPALYRREKMCQARGNEVAMWDDTLMQIDVEVKCCDVGTGRGLRGCGNISVVVVRSYY
jgi:hypothetical protein